MQEWFPAAELLFLMKNIAAGFFPHLQILKRSTHDTLDFFLSIRCQPITVTAGQDSCHLNHNYSSF